MTNIHSNPLDTITSGSNEVHKCSLWLLFLQIFVPLPAIISIVYMDLKAEYLLLLSLWSILPLIFYWFKKFQYLKLKLLANESRRANIFNLGFGYSLTEPRVKSVKIDEISKVVQSTVYDLESRESCNKFLKVLLELVTYSELIYQKSESFLKLLLFIYLGVIIILLILVIANAEGDFQITVSRVILSVVIIGFSSDILNIYLHNSIVCVKLSRTIERLLMITGNNKINIDSLRTSLIDQSGIYTDILAYANEISPYFYGRFRKELHIRWKELKEDSEKYTSN